MIEACFFSLALHTSGMFLFTCLLIDFIYYIWNNSFKTFNLKHQSPYYDSTRHPNLKDFCILYSGIYRAGHCNAPSLTFPSDEQNGLANLRLR